MKKGPLRVLHTSDWHIGHTLYEKKRDDEFGFFLDWLADLIGQRQIDCLLVAGDIFDTATPSNRAIEAYYKFLVAARKNGCRHMIITSGNHDSALLLDTSRDLLKIMDIHVFGVPDTDHPENEVIAIADDSGKTRLVVCAVPFLREKYVRRAGEFESQQDKEASLLDGILAHYGKVAKIAEDLAQNAPIIAMGHLFAASGLCGDRERPLYVGTLGQVPVECFSPVFDYVALGHLHMPQSVGNSGRIRYSGSPIHMGFNEASQQKSVCLLEFGADNAPNVELTPVPRFRRMARLEGDMDAITADLLKLAQVANDDQNATWLEIAYTGSENVANLRERLEKLTNGSRLEILRIRNNQIRETVLGGISADADLAELDVETVFEKCLEANAVAPEKRPALMTVYREALARLAEDGKQQGNRQ